ncbi:hypothetical protein HK098_005753 [Nowakowskiella sp. JEL0407]|nr:hypothetical protein HK098_005753 [Nowakowskiella sp. JEL0407]
MSNNYESQLPIYPGPPPSESTTIPRSNVSSQNTAANPPYIPVYNPTNDIHNEEARKTPKRSFFNHVIERHGRKKVYLILGLTIAILIVVIILIILGATGVIGGQTLLVSIYSANTKQTWMDIIQDDFNRKGITADNNSRQKIVINTTHSSFISSVNAKPDGWSPQTYLVVQQYTEQFKATIGSFFPNPSNPDCQSIAVSPIGIAMWKPMAEALGWPNANIGWKDIINLAGNATGWAAYGKPWGALRFGHGQPEFSNSGRLTLIAALYALTNPTGSITTADVNNTAVSEALRKLSSSVQHMGSIDTDLLNLMAKRGPSYLHAITTYEVNVMQFNLKNSNQERLVFIYPSDGTFWAENPLCVLSSDPIKASAVRKLRDFALSRDSQVKLVQNGLRPVPSFKDIPLTSSGSPFSQENGVLSQKTIENVKQLPLPSADTMQSVIDVWKSVKKPSVSMLVIDTSGSMAARSNGITGLAAVQNATTSFISGIFPQDFLILYQFSTTSKLLTPQGSNGATTNLSTFALTPSWRQNAIKQVNDLLADGSTRLYDSIGEAADIMNNFRAADKAANINRNYGIIVMTDGHDTSSTKYKSSTALVNSLPDGTESDQPHIFTIGFGGDVDEGELKLVANRTNGKYAHGDTVNIASLYQQLSLEY